MLLPATGISTNGRDATVYPLFFALNDTEAAGDSRMLLVMLMVSVMLKLLVNVVI